MSLTRSIPIAIVLLALVGVMTAAVARAQTPSPTPSASPTPTATASPTPTPTPTPPAFTAPAVDSASALLKNAAGQVVGTAQFFQDGQGVVLVKVDVTGLPAGQHGVHIHTVGKCDPPDFTSAGGHFNPAGKKHGLNNPEGPHAGDLPALTVDSAGAGHLETPTNRVTVAAGATTVLDADGSALIIHAGADDQVTDPTGNSGARIACGVIARAPAYSGSAVDSASAQLKNSAGQVVGTAQFAQDAQGVVQIKVDVAGLPAGQHGIHIHTVGKCDPPDFTSAGGHFNPAGKKHGLINPEGPHAGDLPGLVVDTAGAGHLETATNRVTVAAGATTVLDADGSALIIHASADDQLTDPTGNSGARIACGVIARAPAYSASAVDSASAQLKNSAGQVVGTAQFAQDAQGVVQIKVDVTGLPAGQHGIHIHTVGKCDPPDFTSAGGHFNPTAKKHGLLSADGPHAGDLPGLVVDTAGAGRLETTTNRISVSAGTNSVLDADGSALIIHAGADDQLTDPTGSSGGRIVCGVIERPAAVPPTGGQPPADEDGGPPIPLLLGIALLMAGALATGVATRRHA